MFYLTTHSTHFIYGYMASDIWLRTFLIARKETRCRHTGYSFRLTARVLLYAPSHRQDSTYHGLCYTSRGALAGTRRSSVGVESGAPEGEGEPAHVGGIAALPEVHDAANVVLGGLLVLLLLLPLRQFHGHPVPTQEHVAVFGVENTWKNAQEHIYLKKYTGTRSSLRCRKYLEKCTGTHIPEKIHRNT